MKALKVVPVSDMVHKQQVVLSIVDDEPVILAQRSRGRAVLVSIEEWNRLQDELETLRSYIRAESEWMQKNTSEEDWIEADAMLDKWANEHGVKNAAPVLE